MDGVLVRAEFFILNQNSLVRSWSSFQVGLLLSRLCGRYAPPYARRNGLSITCCSSIIREAGDAGDVEGG